MDEPGDVTPRVATDMAPQVESITRVLYVLSEWRNGRALSIG
jgi:hypothetical protein